MAIERLIGQVFHGISIHVCNIAMYGCSYIYI